MTIKTTDLLDLLAYAGDLDLSIFVRQDEDGDYVLKFYELYTNDFDGRVVITEEGESDWNKGTHSFDSMMDTFECFQSFQLFSFTYSNHSSP